MDILIAMPDGTFALRVAHYSYRKGPIGEWVVGEVPLDSVNGTVIARGPEASRFFDEMRKGDPSEPPPSSISEPSS
jgi:hypothetical protein